MAINKSIKKKNFCLVNVTVLCPYLSLVEEVLRGFPETTELKLQREIHSFTQFSLYIYLYFRNIMHVMM